MLTDEELAALTVHSFTLPLNNMTLLLPSSVVAEVLDYREVASLAHMPDWLLGMLPWRGQNVPLFCFERLLGKESTGHTARTRYVVCNTLNGSSRVPFIAIQVDGMPHLHVVTNSTLSKDSQATVNEPVVQAYLRLQGESVIVPNLDVMEKMLERLGISAE